LQIHQIGGSFRLLSNESHHPSEPESGKLPQPNQDRSLESAIHDLRRILSANGEVDGDEVDSDLIEWHFSLCEGYTQKIGCFYDGFQPGMKGGAEHDLLQDPTTGTILKFTKPGKAAYVVDFDLGTPRMRPSLPVEYLERQRLQNDLFADGIRFVGLGGDAGKRRLITRQQIVVGRAARWEEIIRLMVDELGFTKLRHNHGIGYEDSYAFVRDDAAVFDLRPANVFVTKTGIIIPVDCIPVLLPPGKRGFFDK
jgi:hypothetical protein